jgi:alpha-glucosidase
VSQPAAIEGEIVTPWRVVMVARDLNGLVNSDAVHNLCPPPDPALFPEGIRTDWVRPGRAVWKYLDGGSSSLEGMQEFCRLAGELGFEYNILEGFWRRWSDAELKELVNYGRQRGVGLWLWKHSKELRDPKDREAFFQRCQDAGVAGVKIDFFDHEAKEVVDLYYALLRGAAEHRLLVNFHGGNKPTGEPRTWPNELVRESVKGMESSRVTERARHDATLPFTRFLAGHAEYTIVHFGDRRADTTWAHQVATAVVFTAPLLTYAAHPRTILENPCAEMIKSIPAVWDETRVLPSSEIGETAAFARRSGDTWFVGIVNGPAAKDVQLPLSFLPAGEHRALLVRDRAENPAAVTVEQATLNSEASLAIQLSSGGGFVARFSRN